MLKQKFERTRGNRPRVQQFCSTYRDMRDIESFFFPKQTRNVQGTEEFVRSVEKFENLSTRVLGSQLYVVCCAIWYHLYNFENVKNTHGGVLFLVNFTKSNTPSLVFSRFLNCTNGTKSRETPHI